MGFENSTAGAVQRARAAAAEAKAASNPVESGKANDRQVGGEHYRNGGEQHWDRVNRLGLDYFQGQITKYVERWKLKNGIQDLEKAQHFLQKYIELEKAKAAGRETALAQQTIFEERENQP